MFLKARCGDTHLCPGTQEVEARESERSGVILGNREDYIELNRAWVPEIKKKKEKTITKTNQVYCELRV